MIEKCPKIVEGRMDKRGELIGADYKNRYTSTVDPSDLEWDGTWTYSGKTTGHWCLQLLSTGEDCTKGYDWKIYKNYTYIKQNQ